MRGPDSVFHTSVIRSVTEIGVEEWNGLDLSSIYHTHEWLRVAEQSRYATNTYYVTVRDSSGSLLAAACCYLVDEPGFSPLLNLHDLLTGRSLAEDPLWELTPDEEQAFAELSEGFGNKLFPNLICVGRSSFAPGILSRPDVAIEDLPGLGDALIAGVTELARRLRARETAVLYLPPDSWITTTLLHRAAVPVALEPRAVLHRTWDSYEAYLAGLSRPNRQAARYEQRKLDATGLVVAREPLADVATEEMASLILNLHRRWGDDRAQLDRFTAYLDRLRRIALPSFVYTLRKDGVLAAGIINFEYAGRLYMCEAGFDYEATAGSYAYFNLAFYTPAREAASAGWNGVDYGMGSLTAKRARGCSLENQLGYLLPGDSALERAAAVTTQAQRRRESSL